MSNREMRSIELKRQVNDLAAQLDRPQPQPPAFLDAAAQETSRDRLTGQVSSAQRKELST